MAENLSNRQSLTLSRPQIRSIKLALFLFPIVLAFIFLGLKLITPETYNLMVQEDTAIEWLQALFFFLATAFSLVIFYKFIRNRMPVHGILYGILGAGLLFVGLEEISWGQRIFNIGNPGYFEQHNMQGELTLHNLTTVAPLLSKLYIIIGLYGSLGWLLLSSQKLRRKIFLLKFYLPDWYAAPYFFFVLFIYAYLSYIRPFSVEVLGIEQLKVGYFFIFRDQEPAEFLLSMGFLLFAAISYLRLKSLESSHEAALTSINAIEQASIKKAGISHSSNISG